MQTPPQGIIMDQMYAPTQFIEKQIFHVPGERVTSYDFVTLKPLGRSP